MTPVVACAVCGSDRLEAHLSVAGSVGPKGLIPTTDRFGTALADIVRCTSCGHMQLERFPSEADLGRAYASAASDVYLEEEAGQRATARRVLEEMERRVTPGTLLDLGCWTGFLLDEARARGWAAVGVEPSHFASRYARERLGLTVHTAALLDADLREAAFDAIVMGDVIEHLPNPGAALDRVGELLNPGGVICLIAPDAGSLMARGLGRRWWSVIPTHVQFFTRDSIRRLLAAQGFQTLELTSAPKAFSVKYYLERIGGYSPRLARGLVAGARRLGLAERMWAPDFGDRMLVLARRPAQSGPESSSAPAASRPSRTL